MLPQVWHRNLARVTRFKAYSITRSTSYSSLHGKIVAISGAASGMGLATAKLLYPMRVKLSLADINKDALHEAALSLEASASTTTGDVISVAADLRSSSEASAWIQTTVEKYGGLDGAANFAGILGNMTPVAETSDEEWSRVLKVNLNGTFFALRAQLKAMLDGGGKGSIVNTASIAGLRSGYAAAAYTVSKHGVIGLTKSAAKEVGHRGIRVNVIAPGAVDTAMTRNVTPEFMAQKDEHVKRNTPLGRQGEAEEMAKLVAFLLSDESSYITGAVHTIDGGMNG